MKTGRVAAIVEDTLFWVIATAATFFFIFITNSGEIRFFIFIGVVMGAYLYFLTLSRPIVLVSVFVVDVAKTVIRFVFRVLITPVLIMLKPIMALMRLSEKKIKQMARLAKKKWEFHWKTIKISLKNRQKPSKPID